MHNGEGALLVMALVVTTQNVVPHLLWVLSINLPLYLIVWGMEGICWSQYCLLPFTIESSFSADLKGKSEEVKWKEKDEWMQYKIEEEKMQHSKFLVSLGVLIYSLLFS